MRSVLVEKQERQTWRSVTGFLVLFAIALAVRLAYLDGMEAYPRFESIKNRLDDQVVFDTWAKHFAAGQPFDYATTGHEFAHWATAHPGVYPQAPLYPWWIGACYRIFGPRYDLVRALQMGLGALGCVLLAVVARHFVSAWAAWLCGSAMAFYGPLVFYEATYLRAAVTTPVLLTALLLSHRMIRAEGRGRAQASLGAGLAFALLALLRANTLLVAAVVWAWWVVQWRLPSGPLSPVRGPGRPRDEGWGEGTAATLFLVALALPLLFVATLNTVRSDKPAFLSSNGPYIAFISNAHDASGTSAGVSPYYYEVKAKGAADEVDLLAEVLADIRRHPGAWLRLEARKLGAFFDPREIPNNLSYAMARDTNPRLAWAPLDLRWVLPLATLGIVLSLRRWRRFALLHLVLWSYVVGTVLFYVLARMRLPIVPILLIFAALALEKGVDAWRRRCWPHLTVGGVAVLLLGTALWPGPTLHRPTDYAMAAAATFSHAEVLEAAGQGEDAQRQYARTLALNPEHSLAPGRLLDLATRLGPLVEAPTNTLIERCEAARQLAEAGDTKEAIRQLRALTEEVPRAARPHLYLANLHYLEGDKRQAMHHLEAAIERSPLDPLLRRNLVALRGELLGVFRPHAGSSK